MDQTTIVTGIQAITKELLSTEKHLEDDTPLMDAGLDSLLAVEMRRGLEQGYCVRLPSTVIFDYPSLREIGKLLTETCTTAATGEPASRAKQGMQLDVDKTVQSIVCDMIGLDKLDHEIPLMDAGIDSLMAVELRQSLAHSFHLALPSTVLFDFPTITEIVSYIAQTSEPEQLQDHTPKPPTAEKTESSDVKGFALRFAGASH
jgi:acyl carrier protein